MLINSPLILIATLAPLNETWKQELQIIGISELKKF
jgi:hypothetical protein